MGQEALRGTLIKQGAIIEKALKGMGAQGQGLKQLALSVDGQLTPEVRAALRHITHLRNAAAHDADFSVDAQNLTKLEQNQAIVNRFFAQPPRKARSSRRNPQTQKRRMSRIKLGVRLFFIALVILAGYFLFPGK
ncbi:hypothetical protein AwEntero_23140 [Enterobacterales bacterium]|nr:hypothetical protein AwEntero_23140 [Enterobacterales bacterium]